MATGRARVPVIVLVVTAMVGCEDTSPSGYRLSRNCRFTPNTREAIKMECDFTEDSDEQISIHSGDLSSSLQKINIAHCNTMKIAASAFSHLQNLQSIRFSGIESLQIDKNNWTCIKRPWQVSIRVDQTSLLHLNKEAFSGWPAPGPQIVLSNVTTCSISGHAFPRGSVFHSVVLQNIRNLRLNSRSFYSDFGQLKLTNVTLRRRCDDSSFSGRIRDAVLHSVTIAEVGSTCLWSSNDWGSLTIRSSHLGSISDRGIRGNIRNVLIDNSHIGVIYKRGIDLVTATFAMQSTEVTELAPDSLDIWTYSASLQTSSFKSLRSNALRSVAGRNGDEASLDIRQVSVDRADSGSLALHTRTQATLIDVVLREPCRCDVDTWALRLVVGDEPSHNVTDKQRRTARQILDQVRCTARSDTPTLVEFHCQYCNTRLNIATPCPQEASPAPATSPSAPTVANGALKQWVLPVAIVGPLLALVLVGVGLRWCVVRRRRAEKRRAHPVELTNGDNQRKDHTEEPFYEEIPEAGTKYDATPSNAQSSVRHGPSMSGSPSCIDCPHSIQPKPDYCGVLPRPPSSEYMEMASVVEDNLGRHLRVDILHPHTQ